MFIENNYNTVISFPYTQIINNPPVLTKKQLIPLKDRVLSEFYQYCIDIIKRYYVNNFIHHDLYLNRFEESVKFDNDRNIHDETANKYPFMLQYAKEHGNSLLNLSSIVKRDICRYRLILRNVFLQYESSKSIISSASSIKDLMQKFNSQKIVISSVAKKAYDEFEINV